MYLKSIELCGFKSFPSKTVLNFEPGISCIVGPNGSGKSNVVDALRWVLGESSARSIRGGKMDDVIFSGSKKRRALGLAEVTLVLDNSDGYLPLEFSEISVTRRVVRNSSGEYFINGKQCRLKEVKELFADTGMGADGLALINQGRINELISARPEERRALVEEAAGIVKYRERKREAAHRLAETERHLERVGDIINELDGRVEPLRLQSEKATSYLALREQADGLEIGISVKILSEAEEKISALTTQIGALNNQLMQDESQRVAVFTEAEQLRLAIAAMDEQIAADNEHYYQLRSELEKTEGEQRLAENVRSNSEEQQSRLQQELTALTQQLQESQTAHDELARHISRTEQELAAQEQQVLSGEGGGASLAEQEAILAENLAALSRDEAELAMAAAAAESRQQFREEQRQKNEQSLTQLQEEATRLQQQADADDQHLQQLDERQIKLNAEREQLQTQTKQAEQEMQRLSALSQDLAAKEGEARFAAHSAETRLTMLREMAASYEGFFPGVKALMSANSKGQAPTGLLGVVAELIDVPEKFRYAVEAFLGANIQNIICEDAASAQAAVDFLKQKKLGRATFLPLDILRVRDEVDFSAVLGDAGVFGRASELVGAEKRLQPAVDFLLNNVLVVENMKAALAAAKKLKYRASIVTLEGDRVNPGASISGGSRNTKSGDLLSQKSRLADAEAAAKQTQAAMQSAEQELVAARSELQQVNSKIDALQEQLRSMNSTLAEMAREWEQTSFQLQAVLEKVDSTAHAIEQAREELEMAESDAESSSNELSRLKQEQSELQQKMEKVATQLALVRRQMEQFQQEVTESKVALASSQQKLRGQRISLEKLQSELTDLGWEAEEKSADLVAVQQQLAAANQEIAALGERVKQLNLQLLEAGQRLEQARHGFSAESARLQELDRAEKEHLRTQDKLKTELHQLEVRCERWQADFENEAAKLAEKYQLDLPLAKARVGETAARTVMISQLAQVRREINALGNVNVDAIEEYKEVSERFEFLTTQRADMLEARAKLDSVIAEMDTVMSKRFRETFHLLSKAFNDSFVRLFGGGTAELVLSDPEHILETGVEIRVNLPGKKVSNYNLLSGGEKSLIGIALLFAMLEVRPTPFCFMDEVDAALDEANIDRFTSYLTDCAESNQFVMISHRQTTMEAASSLWGITMSEEGVSRVLSVKIDEIDREKLH